jgi:hypothetical protein
MPEGTGHYNIFVRREIFSFQRFCPDGYPQWLSLCDQLSCNVPACNVFLLTAGAVLL